MFRRQASTNILSILFTTRELTSAADGLIQAWAQLSLGASMSLPLQLTQVLNSVGELMLKVSVNCHD